MAATDPDALALLLVQQYLSENGFDAGAQVPAMLRGPQQQRRRCR